MIKMRIINRLPLSISSTSTSSIIPKRFYTSTPSAIEAYNLFRPTNSIPTISSTNAYSITLTDKTKLFGPCIVASGGVLKWKPSNPLDVTKWKKEELVIWEVLEEGERPEIILFGTGSDPKPLPKEVKQYLNSLGVQSDVMSTRNAASTYNVLIQEGRKVAAMLVPEILKEEGAV